MSDQPTHNPPAFPDTSWGPGMSLRDYFAGQALAGWLASIGPDAVSDYADSAEAAYEYAEAMLRHRMDILTR